MLRAILKSKKMSLYELEKTSHVSHATLSDIYNERSNIDNCSILVLSKIAAACDMSIDKLYSILSYSDMSLFAYSDEYDWFRSNTLQELKSMGDVEFIKKYVLEDEVTKLFNEKNEFEAIYLLSLIDYLSKLNNVPLIEKYAKYRKLSFSKTIVSHSVYLLLKTKIMKVSDIAKEAIEEFASHNIVEARIRDVA